MYNLGRTILALLAAAFAVFIVASISWCGGFDFDCRGGNVAMLCLACWMAAAGAFCGTFFGIGPRKNPPTRLIP